MINELNLPLGRRLKVVRIAKGLRQLDVAREAGLPPTTLSLIESDYKIPRSYELEAILKALGLTRQDIGLGKVEE